MKKNCIALLMVAALTVSLSTYAQDNTKKEGACCKAKTEQAEKKSGEGKACCAEKKEKAGCCAEKSEKAGCDEKKEKACCSDSKKAKSSTNKETAATETKSCGKKK